MLGWSCKLRTNYFTSKFYIKYFLFFWLLILVLSQVVLWDKIILRGENALLDYRSMNTKYYFWDDGNGLLSHKNVTMTLSWNIIPNAGNLPR